MLPLTHKVFFLLFALLTGSAGLLGFFRVYQRIRAGRTDTDARFDDLPQRLWYAITTTLGQSRTFRKRPVVGFFHSLIFYGFAFYLLVNLVDGLEGYVPFAIRSAHWPGAVYNLSADLLSVLVLVGVVALVIRRFLLPSRAVFRFNERTLISPEVTRRSIPLDSAIVSAFILFHVGSRALGAGARLAVEGPNRFQPFATLIARAIPPDSAQAWRIFGYWGALGSVLAFLMYFPISKHIHLFMAPAKYLLARRSPSGVLPAMDINLEDDEVQAGASKLEDLAWPRLLDAYACIQCNRCQDVCPATATGKALSPSALEINKRMELNACSSARNRSAAFYGRRSSACARCWTFRSVARGRLGMYDVRCLPVEVCPVQDEPMLDIIDIRRHSRC